ncbi:MAG: hypothetical protein PHS46_08310, partial [Candidatus Omnitrophica bacterium]|nr:hypothetical protein [Candidatus Omnitrophota bacterium]
MNDCEFKTTCEAKNRDFCKITNQRCPKRKGNNPCQIVERIKENTDSEPLYKVRKDVTCLQCGHKGAVRYRGGFYRSGLPYDAIAGMPEIYGKYYNRPYMSSAVGFGGTIPWECT